MPQYFVAENGVSRGPYTLAQVSHAIEIGEIDALTLMWTAGMSTWGTALQVLEGTDIFQTIALSQDSAEAVPAGTELKLQTTAGMEDTDEAGPVVAAFGRRLAAALIDGLVMFVPASILAVLPRAFLPDPDALIAGGVLALLSTVIYFTILQGRTQGATIGKNALDIHVVRNDGGKLGDGLAMGRYALLFLSILLVLPCLVPLFNRHRKGLHDLICGTVVLEGSHEADQSLDLSKSSIGEWSPLTWVMLSLMFLIPFTGGVVAAVSVPAYQDYLIRSQVSIAIEQARDASEKVMDYRSQHGHWPKQPEDIGMNKATKIANVAMMTLDAQGTVALTFTADLISGRALQLRIGEDGHRQCTTNLPRKYTDRACSRATLSPVLASAQPTM